MSANRSEAIPQSVSDAEAAEVLGIKRQTLACWRCRKHPKIPYLKIGRSVRYYVSDLAEFFEKSRRGDTA